MRPISFFVIVLTALLLPLWLFLTCAFLYTLKWSGYELIVVGVLIDAQFGTGSDIFLYQYTVFVSLLVLFLEFLKPHLSWYEA